MQKENLDFIEFYPENITASATKVSGKCSFLGITFPFLAYRNKTTGKWLGKIHAEDSHGKLVQLIGKAREDKVAKICMKNPTFNGKGADAQRLLLERKFSTRASTRKGMEDAIREAVVAFYQKFRLYLTDASVINIESLSFSNAATHYGEDFAAHKGGKKAAVERILASVNRIATTIAAVAVPLAGLDPSKLGRLINAAAHSVDDIRTARDFVEYMRNMYGIRVANNPFERVLNEASQKRKSPSSLIDSSTSRKALTNAEAEKLRTHILNNITDGRVLGVLLISECGFTSEEACSLKWSDVLFDESENASIRLIKDSAKGIRDFTRPITRFAATVLKQRLETLGHSKETVDNLYIVVGKKASGANRFNKDQLNKYCTSVLRSISATSTYIGADGTVKEHTPGVNLLYSNYHVRLLRDYGLDADPAAAEFLCGNSPADTTSRHYRKFAADGYLRSVLERAPALPGEVINIPIELTHEIGENGQHTYSAPQIPERRNYVDIEFDLNADEVIELASRKGLNVFLEVISAEKIEPESRDGQS